MPESTCPVRHQGRALPGRSRRIWPAEAEVRGTNCGPRPVPDGENALYKQGASAALDGKPAEPCGRQCAARSKEDDPCPTGCNLNNPRICSSTGKIPWTGGPGGARHSRPHGRRTSRCSSASATPPATGATSWPMSPLRTRRWRRRSTGILSRSKSTGRSARMWTRSIWPPAWL